MSRKRLLTVNNLKLSVGYARFSRDDTNNALASQIRALKVYAAETLGITLDEVFVEDGVSGTVKPLDRPEMSKIIRLMEEGKVHRLVAYDVTRLARKVGIADLLLDDIFDYGVELHLTTWERAIKDTAKDRDSFNNEAVYADTEKRKIAERTKKGRDFRVKGDEDTPAEFLGAGKTFYGAKLIWENNRKLLLPIEDELAVVKTIFEMYYNRTSTTDIFKLLNAQNIPTPSQAKNRWWNIRKTWDRVGVQRILREEAYAGTFYQYKHVRTKINGVMMSVQRPRDQWIPFATPQLAVVSKEMFDAVQLMIDTKANASSFANAKHQYLMGTRLTCNCGYSIMSHTNGYNRARTISYTKYKCNAKNRGIEAADSCIMPVIDAIWLDTECWHAVESLIRNPELELNKLQQIQKAQQELQRDTIKEQKELEKLQKQFQADIDRYMELYRSKLISIEDFQRNTEPTRKRLESAKEIAAENKAILKDKVITDKYINNAVQHCSQIVCLLDELGELDFDQRKKVIELLNVRGTFVVEAGTLVLNLYLHSLHFDTIIIEGNNPHNPTNNGSNNGQSAINRAKKADNNRFNAVETLIPRPVQSYKQAGVTSIIPDIKNKVAMSKHLEHLLKTFPLPDTNA